MVGDLSKDKSVLIHSGSGGVGQAAINICLHAGCTVYTTVGTEEKRAFIRKRFPQVFKQHKLLVTEAPDCLGRGWKGHWDHNLEHRPQLKWRNLCLRDARHVVNSHYPLGLQPNQSRVFPSLYALSYQFPFPFTTDLAIDMAEVSKYYLQCLKCDRGARLWDLIRMLSVYILQLWIILTNMSFLNLFSSVSVKWPQYWQLSRHLFWATCHVRDKW
jgi:hypothetical protein